MATLVGTQTDFADALKELIALDFDAIEAYAAAIKRLENQIYKDKLTEFKQDHMRHTQELGELLRQHNEEPPSGPHLTKRWLTQSKVVIADLIGDKTILIAMRSNEVDTNTAYQRMNERQDKWPDAHDILARAWEDEKRHKSWLNIETST